MTLYAALRPALFLLPPEKAHRAAIFALQRGWVPHSSTAHPSLATTVAGLSFANPLGLAPGFDKNAECFEGALAAGFGFVEIGTVTPRAQVGNPSPRLFRLVAQEAVINRLGFNNEGVEAAAWRLARRSGRGIVGGNIGKNKESGDALADYVNAMRALYPQVDYITANISSPNTPGLRALQAADTLAALITALHAARAELVAAGAPHRPIFVKIAPDCDDAQLEAIAKTAVATKLDGLIISNTTLAREAVAGSPHAHEAGGLSGKPLFAPSTEVLKKIYRLTQGKVPLIGVGGIASAADAYAKIRAGASLVQLYTALIYQGFGLVGRINDGLAELLARDGFATIHDAVGRDA
ncbi:MAG: quinone-dependent dihydroorotate dehydrogenase [Alphaproteobacteria bacterium]|nr:quinone-dependent dihydroorotate dehydrogenase [Alphaproteobacteria bacterium]